MTAPDKKIRYFVKREKTIQAFEEFMQSPAQVWLANLNAEHGFGKTTVLLHLYRRRSQIKRAWVSLRDEKFRSIPLEEESKTVNIQEFIKALEGYQTLLLSIGADIFGEHSEAYQAMLQEMRAILPPRFERAGKFTAQLNRFVRRTSFRVALKPEIPLIPGVLKASIGELELGLSPDKKETLPELNQKRIAMTDVLVRYLTRLGVGGQALIIMDDVCHIRGSYLEKWILTELAPALKSCKIVLSHTLPFTAKVQEAFPLPLDRFSPAETRQYVLKRLGEEALQFELDEALHLRFDGNPQQLEWAVDGIELIGLSRARELPWLKQAASWNPASQTVALAESQIEILSRTQPSLERAYDVACILRTFDPKLFDHIWLELKLAGAEAPSFQALRPYFEKLSFLEANKQGQWFVHSEVAQTREKNLLAREPHFVANVHHSAAVHYGELMQREEEDSDAGVWERLHRYETSDWRARIQNWLRHLAASPDASLEIATRYFDAYFWWGEFIDFPFCDHLLSHLQGSLLTERNQKIVELLTRFHHSFVPARQRTADTAWTTEALVALGQLLDRLGLHHPAPQDATRWHLRGLLENYVAEAWSVRDPHDQRAEAAYKASAEAFFQAAESYRRQWRQLLPDANRKLAKRFKDQAEMEEWYGGWACIWLAGLLAQLGRAEEAMKTAAFAEKTISRVDPADIEALGRVHAYRGEVYFSQRQWEKALQEYQLFALFALGFLIDAYGVGGDIYTLGYFREMIETLAARIETLESVEATLLSTWWRSLHSFWLPEAAPLLPAELDAEPASPVSALIHKDEWGKVVEHRLPLPRLPEYESLDGYALHLAADYKKTVEQAFYQIRERSYQQGLLSRP